MSEEEIIDTASVLSDDDEPSVPPPQEVMVSARMMQQEINKIITHYERAIEETKQRTIQAGVLGGVVVTLGFIALGYTGYSLMRAWSSAKSVAPSPACRMPMTVSQ